MGSMVSVHGKEIPDSRGDPTIEVTVETSAGTALASVPAGASVGAREAVALPASNAVAAVNGEIAAALAGKEFDQRALDTFLCALDGTPNKSRLGANAILGVSIAFARAQALEARQPLYTYMSALAGTTPALPCPMFNLINGGKHSHTPGAPDVQEFLAVPAGIEGVVQQLNAGKTLAAELKKILDEQDLDTTMGDEGGYAPALRDKQALDLLVQARERAGYTSTQVRLSVDAAASSASTAHNVAWWSALIKRYKLLSVEDPFTEGAPDEFAALQNTTSELVVGDDLTVTHAQLITQAARAGAIKAVILKPNQVGTISEAIDAALAARAAGLTLIASHRSGETMDSFIADFAAGLGCEYLKAGAPTRPERIAKYNRLIEIVNEMRA